MASVSEDVARRAAQRLSGELDKSLPALVEVQLQGGEPAERFEPLATAIALAALLVSRQACLGRLPGPQSAERRTSA